MSAKKKKPEITWERKGRKYCYGVRIPLKNGCYLYIPKCRITPLVSIELHLTMRGEA
jgi:hypothetical protein